jgi:hypothetical protein
MTDQLTLFGLPAPTQQKPQQLTETPAAAVIHNLPLFTGKPETVTLPDNDFVYSVIDMRDPAEAARLKAIHNKERK